jgi:NADH-quinone oxidoreductase subunit J
LPSRTTAKFSFVIPQRSGGICISCRNRITIERETWTTMQIALFIIFGLLAVAGALNLLFQRHPINSALSLIVVMMSLAVLYFSLGAEFLAAAQVIVYAGAIMVLFLFVVMLLNAGEEERTHGSRVAYIAGIPGAAAVFCLLSFVFIQNKAALGTTQLGGYLNNAVSNLTDISHSLFTNLLLPFEVTSILILVAILGAVVLARKEL